MVTINPSDHTYTEVEPLPTNFFFFQATNIDPNYQVDKELRKIAEADEVVAVGPKDHLRALQEDLIKQGYRKAYKGR